MNPPVESPSDRDALRERARLDARRRLLRGSFGVPAVLTLASGSALAAASSPIRCFNNAPLNASDSGFSQYALQQYVGTTAQGNTSVLVVSANDVLALANDRMIQTPAFARDSWILISSFAFVEVKTNGANAPQPDGTRMVAPRFTRTGGTDAKPVFTVTGLVPLGSSGPESGSNTGRIITKSCWSSFK